MFFFVKIKYIFKIFVFFSCAIFYIFGLSNVQAKNTPAIVGKDLQFTLLQILNLRGLSVSKRKGRVEVVFDSGKLSEEENIFKENLQDLWDRMIRGGSPVDLKRNGISLEASEEAELASDGMKVNKFYKVVNSFTRQINKKSGWRFFKYSFKAKDHWLVDDLEKHFLITSDRREKIKKNDKKDHVILLQSYCNMIPILLTRPIYYELTKKLASLAGKSDAEVFLHDQSPSCGSTSLFSEGNQEKLKGRKKVTTQGNLPPGDKRSKLIKGKLEEREAIKTAQSLNNEGGGD